MKTSLFIQQLESQIKCEIFIIAFINKVEEY